MTRNLALLILSVAACATAFAQTTVSPGTYALDLGQGDEVVVGVTVSNVELQNLSIRIAWDENLLERVTNSGDFSNSRLLINGAPVIETVSAGELAFRTHPTFNFVASVAAGNDVLFSFRLRALNYGVSALDVTVINSLKTNNQVVAGDPQAGSVELTGLGEVQFDPSAGTYNTAQAVTASSSDATQIRYTVDGTEPDINSPLFDLETPVPITVDAAHGQTVTIQAIAFDDHEPPRGRPGAAAYEFDMVMPTVEINDVPATRLDPLNMVTIVFSEPVTGFDIDSLTLKLDGGDNLLTGAEPLTSGDNETWTLTGLNTLTAVYGEYALVLGTDGIADFATNLLAVGDAVLWELDASPGISIDPVAPDPINAAVDTVTIRFTEAVNNFDKTDLMLQLDDGGNLLNGSESLDTVDNIAWTLSGLAVFTAADGDYTVTLMSAGSGILDSTGNALVGNAVEQWRMDGAPPGIEIPAIDPNPRNLAISEIMFVFNEHVNGFDLADLTLKLDAGPNLLTDQLLANTDGDNWTLSSLAPLTASAGVYTVAFVGSAAITDDAGNPLPLDGTEIWRVDLTAPVVGIDAVAPDPRHEAVATVTIRFEEPVLGFDISDFTLTVDGGDNLLTNESLMTADTGATWTLGGLAPLTGGAGDYSLNVGIDGITDLAGNPLATGAAEFWTTDTSAPTAEFTAVTPNSRNTSVTTVEIVFNEPVNGLVVGDLTLTRDAGVNLLIGNETLETADNRTWELGGLAGLTGADGDYVLRVIAPGSIADDAGNALVEGADTSWTLDATPPVATISPVQLSPRITAVEALTIGFGEAITGFSIADLQLTRDDGLNLLTDEDLLSGDDIDWTLSGLAAITAAHGRYDLRLVADSAAVSDVFGNEMTVDASISWDVEIGLSGTVTYEGVQSGQVRLDVFAGTSIAGEPLQSIEMTSRATDYSVVFDSGTGTYSFRAYIDTSTDDKFDDGEAVDAVSHLGVLVDGNLSIDFELADWQHDFDFDSGWHLISFPGPPFAADFTKLEQDVTGVIWFWSGASFDIADDGAGQTGYWVYFLAPTVQQLRGLNPANASTTMGTGLNVFGVTAQVANPAGTDPFDSAVWSWGDERFEAIDPATPLEPYRGYQINTASGASLP
jgi:hypothetical protein